MDQAPVHRPALAPPRGSPFLPSSAAAIAKLYAVSVDQLQRWIDQGLPVLDDELLDPMVVCNWLSWGPLHEAPALHQRWQRFRSHFAAERIASSEQVVIDWQRQHRLFIPQQAWQGVEWWLPTPIDTAWQRSMVDDLELRHGVVEAEGGGWRLSVVEPQPVVHAKGAARVITQAVRAPAQVQELDHLYKLLEPVVAAFRYEYRRHARTDVRGQMVGTCLDLALCAAEVLMAAGYSIEIVAGIIAESSIANPHYWLLVTGAQQQRIPIDPTPAAVERMLGGDWRASLRSWIGYQDPWRVTMACSSIGDPRSGFASAVPGAAHGITMTGQAFDLWACQDWVLGSAVAAFEQRSL